MNENKTPTLKEIKAAGYYVNIRHLRAHDAAYKIGSRLETGVMMMEKEVAEAAERQGEGLFSIRPKGGRTEIEVYDPESRTRFCCFSLCHPDDHYVRSDGIKEALKQVTGMMSVKDGVDGFRYRL